VSETTRGVCQSHGQGLWVVARRPSVNNNAPGNAGCMPYGYYRPYGHYGGYGYPYFRPGISLWFGF